MQHGQVGLPKRVQGTSVALGLYTDLMPTPNRRFGEQTTMFADLAKLGQRRGVQIVVLTPGCTQTQSGWSFQGGTWQEHAVRLPVVILRRSGTFQAKDASAVQLDLQRFRNGGRLHSLPRVCGNKWTVLSLFRADGELQSHVPATAVAHSAQEVMWSVRRLGDAYVKPLAGAQGISVYHVAQRGSALNVRYERRDVPRTTERLTSAFNPGTTLMERTFTSVAAFMTFWRSVRLRKCLVQETIPLPALADGRPFDFRWLVQYTDRPTVIARVARVGKPFAVTTNIHTGGTAMPAEEALRLAHYDQPRTLMATLDHVALAAAKSLAQRYGRYAEVGIDLACRPDGSVVLFEVNPTPGRRMLRSLGDGVRQLSLECLLEYAIRASR